jgi:hypothetical protein
MRRWRASVAVSLATASLWLCHGITAQAGFSILLDGSGRPFSPSLLPRWSRYPGAVKDDPVRIMAGIPLFSPHSSSGPLPHGPDETFLSNPPYGIVRTATFPAKFYKTPTILLLAMGQERFARGEQVKDGAAKPRASRPPAIPTPSSQTTVDIDICPPSTLVLALIGCGCCLLWFAGTRKPLNPAG